MNAYYFDMNNPTGTGFFPIRRTVDGKMVAAVPVLYSESGMTGEEKADHPDNAESIVMGMLIAHHLSWSHDTQITAPPIETDEKS